MAMLISRRFHGFYWSFIELGAAALSNEECWFTLMIEFSTIVNSLKGGLSACFAAAVKSFFKEGMHMKHGGITLSLDGGDGKFFAELGAVLHVVRSPPHAPHSAFHVPRSGRVGALHIQAKPYKAI